MLPAGGAAYLRYSTGALYKRCAWWRWNRHSAFKLDGARGVAERTYGWRESAAVLDTGAPECLKEKKARVNV